MNPANAFSYYNRQYTQDDLSLAGKAIDGGVEVHAFVDSHQAFWLNRHPARNRQLSGSLVGGEFGAPEQFIQRQALVEDLSDELKTHPRGTWSLIARGSHACKPSWICLMHDGAGDVLTADLDLGFRPSFEQIRDHLIRCELSRLYFAERCRRQTETNLKLLDDLGWQQGMTVDGVIVAGTAYDRMRILWIEPTTAVMEVELYVDDRLPFRWGGLPLRAELRVNAAR